MNPEIANHWNKTLDYFIAIKVSFQNGETTSDIMKQLYRVITEAQLMTRELETSGEESLISAEMALKTFEQFQQLTVRQAIDKTLKVLRDCHNLVPGDYNLPMPTGLEN